MPSRNRSHKWFVRDRRLKNAVKYRYEMVDTLDETLWEREVQDTTIPNLMELFIDA